MNNGPQTNKSDSIPTWTLVVPPLLLQALPSSRCDLVVVAAVTAVVILYQQPAAARIRQKKGAVLRQ